MIFLLLELTVVFLLALALLKMAVLLMAEQMMRMDQRTEVMLGVKHSVAIRLVLEVEMLVVGAVLSLVVVKLVLVP